VTVGNNVVPGEVGTSYQAGAGYDQTTGLGSVNVANLQLARSTARQREFAVRVALGAQQGRLIRQVLTESLALSLVGGALGVVLAYWGAKAALAAVPNMLPRAENVGISGPVLLFTLTVSILAGVVFGMAPALRTSRTDVNGTLNQSGRSLVGSRHRAQAVFVTIEMAMALVLLVGAGLMIRTLVRLWNVTPVRGSDVQRGEWSGDSQRSAKSFTWCKWQPLLQIPVDDARLDAR